MYRICHLTFPESGPIISPTDYNPMDLRQAESIVTELNRDAIESDSLDRWIIWPQDK